jgi:hypothetical protein
MKNIVKASRLIMGGARSMARQLFGSVRDWKADCKLHPNPAKRNRMVLREIHRRHPEFSAG